MKEYLSSKEQVLSDLSAGEQGLSSQEASSRLSQYGPNKLAEGKQTTLLQRFLSQLADPMIIILIVAAVISGITSFYSGESFADVIIIMIVVVINAVLGVVQESKAEKAIAALQNETYSPRLSSPHPLYLPKSSRIQYRLQCPWQPKAYRPMPVPLLH